MAEQDWERVSNMLQDIAEQYGVRKGTQQEVADFINQKYSTHLTTEDIASVTKQLGYRHTIKRADVETIYIKSSESFRKHSEL